MRTGSSASVRGDVWRLIPAAAVRCGPRLEAVSGGIRRTNWVGWSRVAARRIAQGGLRLHGASKSGRSAFIGLLSTASSTRRGRWVLNAVRTRWRYQHLIERTGLPPHVFASLHPNRRHRHHCIRRRKKRRRTSRLSEVSRQRSDIDLFGYLDGVIDLDAEISNGGFDFGISQRLNFILSFLFLIENQRPAACHLVLAVAISSSSRRKAPDRPP